MKNITDTRNIIITLTLLLVASFTYAQQDKTFIDREALAPVVINMPEHTATLDLIETNKKELRKAARKSHGELKTFKKLVADYIPSLEAVNNWEELFTEAKTLTLSGKLDAYPDFIGAGLLI